MLSFEKLQKNLWLMSSLYSLGSKTNKVYKNSAKVLPNIWKFGLYEKYFSLIRFFFILITIFKLLQRTIHFLFVTSRMMMALVVLQQKTRNEKFLERKSTDEIVLNNEHQYLWNNRITRCSFARLFFCVLEKHSICVPRVYVKVFIAETLLLYNICYESSLKKILNK